MNSFSLTKKEKDIIKLFRKGATPKRNKELILTCLELNSISDLDSKMEELSDIAEWSEEEEEFLNLHTKNGKLAYDNLKILVHIREVFDA